MTAFMKVDGGLGMPQAGAIYTCPMHPELQPAHPGKCPKCGMTLVVKTPTASPDLAENAERRDLTQRFWIGAALTLLSPIIAGVAMSLGSVSVITNALRLRRVRL